MIEKIKQLLKAETQISYWTISEVEKADFDVYCGKNFENENYKFGNSQDIEIDLFVNMKDKIGEFSFSISSNMTLENIKKKIKEGIVLAKQIKNLAYVPLDKYTGYKSVEVTDRRFKKINHKKIQKKLFNMIDDIKKYSGKFKNIKVASCEILTSKIEVKIHTSLNQTHSKEKSRIMVETTFISFNESLEREYVASLEEVTFSKINLKEFVKQNCNIVIDQLDAIKPKEHKGKVLLRDDAVLSFFAEHSQDNPVVLHCSGKLKYNNISKYEQSKSICDGEIIGDKVTITSNPFLRRGLRSTSFDGETIPTRKLVLINESKYNDMFCSKQYADYLRVEPTGALTNIEVKPGHVRMKNMVQKGEIVYEIVSFSWFSPDVFSGDFSAEIRQGYIIENGKRTPFKGGTLVGNVFKIFENLTLSKDILNTGHYSGPRAIIMNDGHVFGE